MNEKIYIGLIDSGCDSITCKGKFVSIKNDKIKLLPLKKDSLGHGSCIANTISHEFANFYCMQVFDKSLVTTAEHIAFATHYLCEKKVDLIHMSLGLRHDRKILKNAILKALNQNISIISSIPSISNYNIYPANYKGVISVTADARCKNDEISFINTHAKFGASPLSNNPQIRGSSVAAAHFSKVISKLHFNGIKNLQEQLKIIQQNATFKTPQDEFKDKFK